MFYRQFSLHFALTLLLAFAFSTINAQEADISDKAREVLDGLVQQADGSIHPNDELIVPRTDIVEVVEENGSVVIVFNAYVSFRKWNEESAAELKNAFSVGLGVDDVELMVEFGRREPVRIPFETLVTSKEQIRERQLERQIPAPDAAAPVVQRVSYQGAAPEMGLAGKHLVIAQSHGWTWHKENRWQMQRCRLNTTVEDLYTASYINPFLLPMLENAGAVVFTPRERDYQTAEVIVDNDEQEELSSVEFTGDWSKTEGTGWYGGLKGSMDNFMQPFTLGTSLSAEITEGGYGQPATGTYIPYVPRDGRYAVRVSWDQHPHNSHETPVIVRHKGGETVFHVNQQSAGNMWVFLGFFEFEQGANKETGSITVTTNGAAPSARAEQEGAPTRVSIDAVRLGGGMGNVAPEGQSSGKPRYAEAARYYLQYNGAPADSIYYRDASEGHFGPDYIRDYMSRSEWPNYLMGAPFGPNDGYSDQPGLNVPVDLYLSWHTDAGVDHDGLTGTLMIYTIPDADGDTEFPDGRSRWLNRDFASILSDEIIRTGREEYTSSWQRRWVQYRSLAESSRPNVPSALIELLSHQNFNDMKYGLDPRFKFDMSRAIYKSIVRFLAYSDGREPVIQPLPPTHVSAIHQGEGTVRVSWREQPDALEPSAAADGYVLYTSADGKAFDNGVRVEGTSHALEIPHSEARYFRVTAYNAGGESFPSRVVGARWVEGEQPVLIVDGFDRVGPPAWVENEKMAGFDRNIDPGVGWHKN